MTILLGSTATMLLALSTPIFAPNYSVPKFMVLIHWSSNLRVRAIRLNPWASKPHMRESHGSSIKSSRLLDHADTNLPGGMHRFCCPTDDLRDDSLRLFPKGELICPQQNLVQSVFTIERFG
jgi:hypothetical protein